MEPPVVRVLDVPSAATLPELHDVLQAAMGWTLNRPRRVKTAGRIAVTSHSWGITAIALEWFRRPPRNRHVTSRVCV